MEVNTLAQSIIEENIKETTNQTGKKSKSGNPSKRINKQKILIINYFFYKQKWNY